MSAIVPVSLAVLGLTLLALAAVVVAIRRLPGLWRSPRPTSVFPGWDPDQGARAWPSVLGIGAVVATVVAIAAWVAHLTGRDAPQALSAAVAVALLAWLLVPQVVGLTGRPRFLVPPSMRTRAGRERLHQASVLDVRPAPGTEEYEPYFIAACDCGWTSDPAGEEAPARRAALEHTPNVRAEVERPL